MVIGGGGREHALVWKIRHSPMVQNIYVVPGNAGTASLAENLDYSATDIEGISQEALERNVDLAVVGPEGPLAAGIVDRLTELGVTAFGPHREAARLESSKVFARELMEKYVIPCPKGTVFTSYDEARRYVGQARAPMVVKADGLAAGKGTVVAGTRKEAEAALEDIMDRRVFGEAGDRVIVDEFVPGREVSLVALTDGKTVLPMLPACDYKKIGDGDRGPNTGGMGSYCPPGFFPPELVEKTTKTVLIPAVRAMANEGIPFRGVLYAGLMVRDGDIVVLEFNVRFGDPETQAMLPLLKSDLIELILAVAEGRLDRTRIQWSERACVGVVMASEGYPGRYRKGLPITGLDSVENDLLVFHAGTKLGEDGRVYTSGGRVLTVAATGQTMAEARERAYRNLPVVRFDGAYYRTDIGLREVG
ncbi:MAG: phosphoribosylamine--glycine ligase [Chloroflexota bacterium]